MKPTIQSDAAKKQNPKNHSASRKAKKHPQATKAQNADQVTFQKFIENSKTDAQIDERIRLQKKVEHVVKKIPAKHKKRVSELKRSDLVNLAMAILSEIHRRSLNDDFAHEYSSSHAEVLGLTAHFNLTILRFLALKGHKVGLATFYNTLRYFVECLNEDALTFPTVYQSQTQHNPTWPVIYCPKLSMGTDVKKVQEGLEIGSLGILDLKPNSKGKSWSMETPSNQLAVQTIETMSQISCDVFTMSVEQILEQCKAERLPKQIEDWLVECKKLPLFSKDSIDEWADHAWKYIHFMTDGRPEAEPRLRIIGKAREPFGEGHVRARIKEELRTAMSRLLQFCPEISALNETRKHAYSWRDYVHRHADMDMSRFYLEMERIEEDFSIGNSEATSSFYRVKFLTWCFNNNIPLEQLHEYMMFGMASINKQEKTNAITPPSKPAPASSPKL